MKAMHNHTLMRKQNLQAGCSKQAQIGGAPLGISTQMIFKRDIYVTPGQTIVSSS